MPPKSTGKLRIAHVINPVRVDASRDLFYAQPITFQTMKTAKRFCRDKVNVRLYAAAFPEDRAIIPRGFTQLSPLDRSVLDVGRFELSRRLPIFKDILDSLHRTNSADYYIYTNVDIALMPYFYLKVKQIVDSGHDAFLINRRTLNDRYRQVDEIPAMYADPGEKHPGHDCFVFPRAMYDKFILKDACIGARLVARSLMSNMMAFAENYQEFKNLHMTFHIGDNRDWMNPDSNEYYYHNVAELMKIFNELWKRPDINHRAVREFYKMNFDEIMETRDQYPDHDYLQHLEPLSE